MSKKSAAAQEKLATNFDEGVNDTITRFSSLSTSENQFPKVETLSAQEKTELDDVKAKHIAAQEKMQTMVLQVQNAELTYNNVILRIALKYGLIDGDTINENGEITRKVK